jgi:hypothetical protein
MPDVRANCENMVLHCESHKLQCCTPLILHRHYVLIFVAASDISKHELSGIYGTYRFPRTSAAVLGRHFSAAPVGPNTRLPNYSKMAHGAAAVYLGNVQATPYTL